MKLISLFLLLPMLAFGGLNPVLQNPYTTNSAAAADAHAALVAGGPTNGVSATTVTNIVVSIVPPLINSASNALQLQINTNAANIALATTTNGVNGLITAAMGASNFVTHAALTSSNFITGVGSSNFVSQSVLTGSNFVSQTTLDGSNYVSLTTLAGSNFLTQATAAATYQPAGNYATNLTAAANSYTTNITIGTVQASWTVTLPTSATNYFVAARLYLVATTANPSGITLPLNGLIDCSYVIGTLFPAQPYTILPQGDGKTFVVSMDGDKANFLDNTGQPYSFSQANVAAGFKLQANFTWAIHK